jgi:hypothetical protein
LAAKPPKPDKHSPPSTCTSAGRPIPGGDNQRFVGGHDRVVDVFKHAGVIGQRSSACLRAVTSCVTPTICRTYPSAARTLAMSSRIAPQDCSMGTLCAGHGRNLCRVLCGRAFLVWASGPSLIPRLFLIR